MFSGTPRVSQRRRPPLPYPALPYPEVEPESASIMSGLTSTASHPEPRTRAGTPRQVEGGLESKPLTHGREVGIGRGGGEVAGRPHVGTLSGRSGEPDGVADTSRRHLVVANQPRIDRKSGGVGRGPSGRSGGIGRKG